MHEVIETWACTCPSERVLMGMVMPMKKAMSAHVDGHGEVHGCASTWNEQGIPKIKTSVQAYMVASKYQGEDKDHNEDRFMQEA